MESAGRRRRFYRNISLRTLWVPITVVGALPKKRQWLTAPQNLADFRSKSVINWIAYIGIYAGVVISFARYAADVYALLLLAWDFANGSPVTPPSYY